MGNTLFLLKSFRLLLDYQPWRLLLLFVLTILLGAGQGFSVALLIPFLQLLEVGTGGDANPLVRFFAVFLKKQALTLRSKT